MRVKLSYTVEEEDIFIETAKLIGLSGTDLQQAAALFTTVQEELGAATRDPAAVVNVTKALEMIEEFREALLNVDTRLGEAVEIIKSYEDYRREQPATPPDLPMLQAREESDMEPHVSGV